MDDIYTIHHKIMPLNVAEFEAKIAYFIWCSNFLWFVCIVVGDAKA